MMEPPKHHTILVVDDEPIVARALSALVRSFGHGVELADNVESAIDRLSQNDFDVVLTDVRMGSRDGFDLLRHVQTHTPSVPVVLITGDATTDAAMAAIQAGAYDYLSKPPRRDELAAVLNRAIERKSMVEEVQRLRRGDVPSARLTDVAGRSPSMLEVFKTVARVAAGRTSVLILGESGTGKELVARALHQQSPRAAKRFVAVNLAAIPGGLLESELFGHRAGAFTGARETRRGLFEEAHQGTLFLDEIGDLEPSLQAKLLRAIQEHRIKPVGGNEEIEVDVRLVGATHRDLETMVRDGGFREDLYYRLNVVSIPIPPLRARREDIPILIEHFLKKYEKETGSSAPRLTQPALERMERYDWPGNVRELENVVERAILLCTAGFITPDVLPSRIEVGSSSGLAAKSDGWPSLDQMVEGYVMQVLDHTQGNVSKAAQILGISRRTLQRKGWKRDERDMSPVT